MVRKLCKKLLLQLRFRRGISLRGRANDSYGLRLSNPGVQQVMDLLIFINKTNQIEKTFYIENLIDSLVYFFKKTN